jgi:hypothetical protein
MPRWLPPAPRLSPTRPAIADFTATARMDPGRPFCCPSGRADDRALAERLCTVGAIVDIHPQPELVSAYRSRTRRAGSDGLSRRRLSEGGSLLDPRSLRQQLELVARQLGDGLGREPSQAAVGRRYPMGGASVPHASRCRGSILPSAYPWNWPELQAALLDGRAPTIGRCVSRSSACESLPRPGGCLPQGATTRTRVVAAP